jgi:hypothetical protein
MLVPFEEKTWKRSLIHDRGGEVVGLNPSIRIYRYSKGQFFDCHCESWANHVILNGYS